MLSSLAAKCRAVSFDPTNDDKLRCVFCNGAKCKRCGELAYTFQESNAIPKFNSTWITESVLAMQRPSDALFDKGLLARFEENNIVAVFNLCEPGEHPYCGYGIIASTGFPYTPERLMTAGINHFNYSWPDMTVPPMSVMRDIVNVARCEIQGKKKRIAVHCHAGFGRTGIVIACILIACQNLTANSAIELVRLRRPGSVQTPKQERFVYGFEAYYKTLLLVFDSDDVALLHDRGAPVVQPPKKTIAQSIRDQAYILPVAELNSNPALRWSHKVVHCVLKAFKKYSTTHPADTLRAFTGLYLDDGSQSSAPLSRYSSDTYSSTLQQPTADISSPSQRFHLSKKIHFKLANKMKAEANRNKWMLFETAVDMMTHAHVSMEPTVRRRSSEKLLPVLVEGTTSTTGSPVVNLRKSDGQNVTNSPTIISHVAVNTSHGAATPKQPRSVQDDELANCSAALAHCFFEWIDSRSDIIFNPELLKKIRKAWDDNFGKKQTHVRLVSNGRSEAEVFESDQPKVVDESKNRRTNEPEQTATEPDGNFSLIPPASIDRVPSADGVGYIPDGDIAMLQEDALTAAGMDYDATPNEITTELDRTFDVIAKSSKRIHHPHPTLASRSSLRDGMHHSLSGALLGKDVAASMDWDSINMYKTVFAIVESELDRYQLQLLDSLVQVLCCMRIGCLGSKLGTDELGLSRNVSVEGLDKDSMAKQSSEPKKQVSDPPSPVLVHASTAGSSRAPGNNETMVFNGVEHGEKMYMLTCLRLAITLVQPERVLVGDYLMSDTSLSIAVADAFECLPTGRMKFSDQAIAVNRIRDSLVAAAKPRAECFAKFTESNVNHQHNESSSGGGRIMRMASNGFSGLLNNMTRTSSNSISMSSDPSPKQLSSSTSGSTLKTLPQLAESANEAISEKGPSQSESLSVNTVQDGQGAIGGNAPSYAEEIELVEMVIERVMLALNILLLLIDNHWAYDGPKNRLRFRSSHSGSHL